VTGVANLPCRLGYHPQRFSAGQLMYDDGRLAAPVLFRFLTR
jgi:hypothetical protein